MLCSKKGMGLSSRLSCCRLWAAATTEEELFGTERGNETDGGDREGGEREVSTRQNAE